MRQHHGRRVKELEKIAARAAEEEVPFLLAGGHAVITHGFARSTFDLDLIVRRSDLEKWLVLAQALGYQLSRQGPAFVQFDHPDADSFPLDLMLVNDDTFSKLRAGAIPAPTDATGVWVVSLLHLLALKCHAVKHGHRRRIVKDAEDVIQLISKNKLDPDAQIIRDLFRTHGTPEFYEKVRRACRGE